MPVRIHGPWSNLSYTPDLENAVLGDLNRQAKEAEEALREQLEEKVNEAVGGTDGASIEDQINEALQNEAEKALQDLLGGGN